MQDRPTPPAVEPPGPAPDGVRALAARLAAIAELDDALREAIRVLRELLGFRRGVVHLVGDGELVVRVTDPPILLGPNASRWPVGAGLTGEVALRGEPRYVPDLSLEPPTGLEAAVSAEARSFFAAPLAHRGRVLGVLQLDAPEPEALSTADRDLATRAAAALAAEVARRVGADPEPAADDTPVRHATEESSPLPQDRLAMAAHELKTPITSVRGLAETLAERAHRMDRSLIGDIARRIARAAVRMQKLVDDLLIASSDRLVVNLVALELEPFLHDVVREDPSHPTELDVEPGLPPVRTDPERLGQVLGNLLSNARKFSDEGAPIRVSARREGAQVAIEVRDEGPGIAPEHLDRIFEPFYRIHPEDPVRRGLGLGLYLVRSVTEAIGGSVDVLASVGEGSIFTVRLPLVSSA